MCFISLIMLSLSLSMDAFSLALAYGTLNLPKTTSKKLSYSVGIFHFFMPILGMSVKYALVKYYSISFEFITFIIYIYLGVVLLMESTRERQVSNIQSTRDIFLFSFVVSLDSFSVGIALKHFTFLAPLCFAVCSFLFTSVGLNIGKNLYHLLGKVSVLFGGIFFLILAFFSFFTV